MDKKFRLALLALLGFSTACSTVKSTAKGEGEEPESPSRQEQPVTTLMYGVRRPVPLNNPDSVNRPGKQPDSSAVTSGAAQQSAEKPTQSVENK